MTTLKTKNEQTKSPEIVQRALTGVGRTALMSEISSNRSIFIACHLYDSILPLEDVTKRLNEKLILFDRFKSKVTDDCQYFQIIDDFDCNECIIHTIVKAEDLSDHANIHEFLEETLSSFTNKQFTMRSSKPLWRLHLYHFPSLNQTASIIRCHHCICDGISFGEIWLTLSDNASDLDKTSIASLSRSSSMRLNEKCNSFWHQILYFMFWFIGMFLVIFKLIIYTASRESQTIFKNKLSERKEISYITDKVYFDKLNKKRKSLKINGRKPTFNDFMLAVIAESISLYLQSKNESTPNYIHVGIPVNIRDRSTKEIYLGNRIGSYVVKLPINSKLSFIERLKLIKSELDWAKKTPEAYLSHIGFRFLSILPTYVADILGPKITGGMSLVVSNVRAPSNVQFCNSKILNFIGIVPPPMGVGLGYVIVTSNGYVSVAVNVDRNCYDENTAKELIKSLLKVLKKQECI